MTQLRFAPLVRVSTEAQEQKGESLNTQTAQIKSYVEQLQGVIPEHCWRYKGQEHATPAQERQILDQLMADCEKDLFDAIIVTDIDRFARDNKRVEEAVEIMKRTGIRFFDSTNELDLYNPNDKLRLTMWVAMGQWQADHQAKKSIQNRINRAKRGIPTAGHLPYGRRWDAKSETWSVDPNKQRIIKTAARRYLDGESIPTIAKSYGMNHANLNKILTRLSGTEWPINFNNDRLNIHETVMLEIPELLDSATRTAIHQRTELNKTYNGVRKHYYLLSKFIRCAHCGYTLMGFTNHNGKLYYRHANQERKRPCVHMRYIPAVELDTVVLVQLFEMFGDMKKIREAVERATPDADGRKILTTEQTQLHKDQERIQAGIQKLVDALISGTLSEDDIRQRRTKFEEQATGIETRLSQIEQQLVNVPDPEAVKRLSKLAKAVRADAIKQPGVLLRKEYALKRKLIEHAFSGTDSEGNPLGIFIEWTGVNEYSIEIRGALERTVLGWEKIRETVENYIPTGDDYSLYLQNKTVFSINIVQTTAGNQDLLKTA